MPNRSSEYTHGATFGKNLLLLFRAFFSLGAFAVFWSGAALLPSRPSLAWGLIAVGAVAGVLAFVWNLAKPFLHRGG